MVGGGGGGRGTGVAVMEERGVHPSLYNKGRQEQGPQTEDEFNVLIHMVHGHMANPHGFNPQGERDRSRSRSRN